MKRLWLALILNSIIFSQDVKKHNISLGMFDDKTGFSLIGYTYNIQQTEMDEFFIGGGTMLMAFTGSAGSVSYTHLTLPTKA